MAKKNAEEIEDQEDDLLEEQEDDSDDQEDSEEKPTKKKKEEEDDSEEEAEEESEEPAEESDDSSEENAESDERKEIRDRRKRERALRKQRARRERELMQETLLAMAEEIRTLKEGQGAVVKNFEGITAAQLHNEMKELNAVYRQAQQVMEKAITDGDGARFAKAKEVSDQAARRFAQLDAQASRYKAPATKEAVVEKQETKQTEQQEAVILKERGKRFATNFIEKNKKWYDPHGKNQDSKVVLAIDTELYNEGYDPETKDYWDELEDRLKKYLPHRFRSANPKQIVGGSASGASVSKEKSLPKEFVQTLKAAGFWEDPVKRKLAIKDYYAQQKGA